MLPIVAVTVLALFACIEWEVFIPERLRQTLRQNSLHVINRHLNDDYRPSDLPTRIRPEQTVTLQVSSRARIVNSNITVDKGGRLIIPAGTERQFAPGVAIFNHGSILAEGTKDRPIHFTAQNVEHGWGHIAITYAKNQRNEFEHCTFSYGRGKSNYTPDIRHARNEEDLQRIEDTFGPVEGEYRTGGAMLIYDSTGVVIDRCRFVENEADAGGALYIRKDSAVRVTNSVFSGNRAVNPDKNDAPGGAIYVQSSRLTVLKNTQFVNNRAVQKFSCGGAVYVGFLAAADFEGAQFARNSASYAGGAIYCYNEKPSFREPAVRNVGVESSEFIGNRASWGSSVFIDQGVSGQITESKFRGNRSGLHQVPHDAAAEPPPDRAKGGTIVVYSNNAKNEAVLSIDEGSYVNQRNAVVQAQATSDDKTFNDVQERGHVSANLDDRLRLRAAPPLKINFMPLSEKLGQQTLFKVPQHNREVDTVVIHHISATNWFDPAFQKQFKAQLQSLERELKLTPETLPQHRFEPRLCRAILEAYGLSSHYMIGRDGTLVQLVKERDIAFHAGESRMPEGDLRSAVNDFSIGVELIAADAGSGTDVEADPAGAYTDAQYEALRALLRTLHDTHSIKKVVGHNEIAPGRKMDPGPLFDWGRIRNADMSPKE
jgi:predicted outer membrane repeat protein